jgi:hypothetical protein
MSNASRNAGSSPVRDVPADVGSLSNALRRSVLAPVRFLAFWTAVLLPLAYLPLVYGGLQGGESTVLLSLVVVNALALVVGHGYGE